MELKQKIIIQVPFCLTPPYQGYHDTHNGIIVIHDKPETPPFTFVVGNRTCVEVLFLLRFILYVKE